MKKHKILYVLQFNNYMIKVGKTSRSFGYRLQEYRYREQPLKILKEFWLETDLERQ